MVGPRPGSALRRDSRGFLRGLMPLLPGDTWSDVVEMLIRVAPLRQPACVARGLEQAVRLMWQRWCAGLPAEHFEIKPSAVLGLPEVGWD